MVRAWSRSAKAVGLISGQGTGKYQPMRWRAGCSGGGGKVSGWRDQAKRKGLMDTDTSVVIAGGRGTKGLNDNGENTIKNV